MPPDQHLSDGVYSAIGREPATLVHAYQGGDYRLEDIPALFQLGRLEPGENADQTVLTLTAAEVRELKVMADAYSFDHPEAFIEMCLEMKRWTDGRPADAYRFVANF
jgi:hypothetical protein